MRALSRPGTEGLFILADARFFHTAGFACAAVVADILTSANKAEVEPVQFFTDQNLATVGGYTQSPQLIQVIQELTLERDSFTDGQCALQQFASKRKTSLFLEYCYNKAKFY